ncbi:GNAT family N-acetyltransferase [Motilimonas cestriensis]|uniref:GNAT family N-acetyltransferase n=1 Tax=Motilimonas cestriensis TaxID=2742685 RepID=UPI003DA202F8
MFYLTPEWRGLGIGQKIHDFVMAELAKQGCVQAQLRYIPGNTLAELFYARNHWKNCGEPGERGQLAVRKIR